MTERCGRCGHGPISAKAERCPSCGAAAWTLPRPAEPFVVEPPVVDVYVPAPHYGMPDNLQPAYGVPVTQSPVRMLVWVAFFIAIVITGAFVAALLLTVL